MHVHWSWIKQRPHFIAECLADEYDVTVCYQKSYRSRLLTLGILESKIRFKELFILPFSRFKLIAAINHWLICRQLSEQLNNYDIIWLTHPGMYGSIMYKIPVYAHVVYDCMDDALEFPCVISNTSTRQQLASIEKHLMTRCNTVFTTAHHLKNKLIERYGNDKMVHVINNAINVYNNEDELELSPELLKLFSSIEVKTIIYIGTISEWFDFDLIQKSVEQFKNIAYVLIGPTDVVIPQHEHIIYHPPVEHKKIQKILKLADALVMPFLINELVLSVNPVKVYEYIYSAKPAIVIKYKETEKFSDFVHLYKSEQEYFNLIEQVTTGKLFIKSNSEDYLFYARQNTWTSRVSEICKLLNKSVSTAP